jgi:hypothetical protein
MMSCRTVANAAALGLALLSLAGCGHPGDAPEPDKATAAIKSLGGNPDDLYQEKVIFKPVGAEHFDVQNIYLVPSEDGKTFEIVDLQGRIYRDYDDFLLNNSLPE